MPFFGAAWAAEYTELKTTTIKQRQAVPYEYTLELLFNILASVHGIGSIKYTTAESGGIGQPVQQTKCIEVCSPCERFCAPAH